MNKILITGGAGFIGINLAARALEKKMAVVIIDNLSRNGSKKNLDWLKHIGKFTFINCDVSNFKKLKEAIVPHKNVDTIVHLAAQVAVSRSIANPKSDFKNNLIGTFNILEILRQEKIKPLLVYASTNKVYGDIKSARVTQNATRYHCQKYPLGIPESMPLDFYSPYGCSKGAAEQYVHDYHRIFGIPTVVMRQSCIYGPRQFGQEDQGWLAWFIIASLLEKPITIYGNGKQVRDVLYIDDLVDAYLLAINKSEKVAGKIFNIGGGPQNSISVWEEFGPLLQNLMGKKIKVIKKVQRPGDQPFYISDIRLIKKELGWKPKVSPKVGVKKLYDWVIKNRNLIESAQK